MLKVVSATLTREFVCNFAYLTFLYLMTRYKVHPAVYRGGSSAADLLVYKWRSRHTNNKKLS